MLGSELLQFAMLHKSIELMIDWLSEIKDAVTTTIAMLVVLVGGYQYFELRSESRIENALEILKRREQAIFVDARTYTVKKFMEGSIFSSELSQNKTYTKEIIEKITKEIQSDELYRNSLLNISTYYNNASACTLDGICDAATMCASLAGEIQDYLSINKGYVSLATFVRQEDAKSLTLSLPEFVEFCDKNIGLNIFSRHDYSTWCSINLFLERRFSIGLNSACIAKASKYDTNIEKDVGKLRRSSKQD